MIRSGPGTVTLVALVMAPLLSCPLALAQAAPRLPEPGRGLEVGMMTPDVALASLAGPSVRLADLRGKVVLLNFWSTWCRPCRREMPSMQRAYDRLRSRGFEILAVSLNQETDGTVRDFLQARGFTFPVLSDPKEQAADLYGVHDLPTSFLLDGEGRIVRKVVGELDWDGPKALALIEALLPSGTALVDSLTADQPDRC